MSSRRSQLTGREACSRRPDGIRIHLLGVAEDAASGGLFHDQIEADLKHNATRNLTAVVTCDALGPPGRTWTGSRPPNTHTASLW
jgi:hypothetical protein